MGKKIKPKTLIDNVELAENLAPLQEDACLSGSCSVSTNVAIQPGNEIACQTRRLTREDQEKLLEYDAMKDSIAQLSKEYDELRAQTAKYIEQLTEFNSIKNENASLKSQMQKLQSLSSKNSNDELMQKIKKLEKDNVQIQETADKYLLKISDLSYQNAQLMTQIDQLNTSLHSVNAVPVKVDCNQPQTGKPKTPKACNPYRHNGYAFWN